MARRRSIVAEAFRNFRADNATMLASALAYSTFFAIPSVLLVVVGVFTLTVGPSTITSLTHHLSHVIPGQAATLLDGSLKRLDAHPSESIALTVVGAVLAVWSTTGAMTTYMTAVNLAYGMKDKRNFVRKRLIALEMVGIIGVAFLLVAVLLIFGPSIEHLVARHAGGASGAVGWIWWIAQWPILLAGLTVAFAVLLCLGPDRTPRRWQVVTPGAALATIIWLGVSGAFAYYTSRFGSYNKTWGSLSAVIVMLTWLWLTGIALLFGAEIDAEVERRAEVIESMPRELQRDPQPPRTAEPPQHARHSASR